MRSMKEMQKESHLYRETGGCHGAAIFDLEGSLISVMEDIGRHNAIDKVIGDILFKRDNFQKKIILALENTLAFSKLEFIWILELGVRIPV